MSKPEFICPRTQEECLFEDFCSIRKASMELTSGHAPVLKAILDRLREEVPPELVTADNGSFCADERLESIAAVVLGTSAESDQDGATKVLGWAAAMSAGILNDRSS